MPQANAIYPACLSLCLIASALLLSGCQHVNVAQLTYEALRAEDCRRNQLEDFCERTYAFEYHEYERMRQAFLKSHVNTPREQLRKKVLPESLTLNNAIDAL